MSGGQRGKRRAAVLLALGATPKTISVIARETGLKWQVVSDILDSPGVAPLVEFGAGVRLADTPEAAQAQAEARALCATVQASEQPENPDHHSTVSSAVTSPGSLKASPTVRGA